MIFRCSRWGEQEHGSGDVPGIAPFAVNHETNPTLIWPASAVLSIQRTEKLSNCVTATSGTEGIGHISDRQRILQSRMSCWNLILALKLSILFSIDWTLASRILARGGLWALVLSLLQTPARFPLCFLFRRLGGSLSWPLFPSTAQSVSVGHVGSVDKTLQKR